MQRPWLFQVQTNPRVTGILQNRRMILSIDKALVLFQDENRCNEGNILDVSHDIECIAASESGDLVVCGLSNGTITGFHVRGANLFSLYVEHGFNGYSELVGKLKI